MVNVIIHFFKKYHVVLTTLSVSAVLRWILIFRGGQFYFPDESRYGLAQDAAALLLEGNLKTALLTLTDEFAHFGFKVIAMVPAVMQNLFHTTAAPPAIFFSLFSILNLFLIWKIALRAGGETIANYAILLAACSQVLMYYARHFLPYDLAMFFGLLALYIALEEPVTPKQSFFCGILGFFCLVSYNGYWAIAAFGMSVNLFNGTKEKHWFWKRSLFLGLGFLISLSLLLGIYLATGKDFFDSYRVYIQKITQGAFGEGWSLPFVYFWHAEHFLFPILGLLCIATLFRMQKQADMTARVGLAGFLFIYLCLVIPSNLTHSFVVYGRLARQLMPFLVLAAASSLGYLAARKPAGRWLVNSLIIILVLQLLWNYRSSYLLVYPREFAREVQENYPDFQISPKMMGFFAPLVCHNNGFLAVNFHYIYDWSQPMPPVQGEILLKASHPVNFLPYQYEGYPPEQRQELRRRNFEMIFSRLDASSLSNATQGIENCYHEKQ